MANLSIFAGEYQGNTIRVTEDGRFSVFDVLVAFVTEYEAMQGRDRQINPRQVYKSITERNSEVVHFVDNYKFPGKGQRETPVANEEGIYKILMCLAGECGAEFRSWAAKIVRERVEEEANPELAYTRGRQRAINTWRKQGLTDSHIQERLDGIQKRLTFTDHLKLHGVEGPGYAQCTNAIYEGLYNATAQELRQAKGIAKRTPLRDAMTEDEVREIGISEDLAAMRIKKRKVHGTDGCADVSRNAARYVRQFLEG